MDKELLEKAMELIARGVLREDYATNEEMFELKALVLVDKPPKRNHRH